MSELSWFVYIRCHVTLHMKSNAENVNCLWSLYIKLTLMAWVSEWYYRTKQKMAVYFSSIVNLLDATV